jgi:hypothetical protein
MDKFLVKLIVYLPAQTGHLDVDYVVQRSMATGFFPNIPRQHFAGHNLTLMAHQILQQLELPSGKVKQAAAARN